MNRARLARFIILSPLLGILSWSGPAFAGRIVFSGPQPLHFDVFIQGGPVASADLNADGDRDLLLGFLSTEQIADTVGWLENDGHRRRPSFAYESIPFGISEGVQAFALADLDEDGDIDFALGTGGVFGGSFDWYENDGSAQPSFIPHPRLSGWTPAVATGDIDGDGDVDLVSCQFNADRISWHENDPTHSERFVRHDITDDPDDFGPLEGFPDGVNGIATADLDGDGDIDLVSSSLNDHTIAWYENDGEAFPVFTPREISTDALFPIDVIAADMDGDGDIDVLAASRADDKIAWHENGSGIPLAWTEHVIVEDPDGFFGPLLGFIDDPWRIVAVDLDLDGDMDVLSSSIGDSYIAWYENDGKALPSFRPRVISAELQKPNRPHVVDLDGDGDLDIIVGESRGPTTSSPLFYRIENRATLPHSKGGKHWRKPDLR